MFVFTISLPWSPRGAPPPPPHWKAPPCVMRSHSLLLAFFSFFSISLCNSFFSFFFVYTSYLRPAFNPSRSPTDPLRVAGYRRVGIADTSSTPRRCCSPYRQEKDQTDGQKSRHTWYTSSARSETGYFLSYKHQLIYRVKGSVFPESIRADCSNSWLVRVIKVTMTATKSK